MVRQKTQKKVSLADLGESPNIEVVESVEESGGSEEPSDSISVLSEEYDDFSSAIFFSSESLLEPAEREMYLRRRREYLNDFNINKSADISILHQVIMEEIMRERFYSQMLQNPNRDFSQQINDATTRLEKALKQLAAGRAERIKNRETGGVSIADAAKKYLHQTKPQSKKVKEKRDAEDTALEEHLHHKLNEEVGIIRATIGEDAIKEIAEGKTSCDVD